MSDSKASLCLMKGSVVNSFGPRVIPVADLMKKREQGFSFEQIRNMFAIVLTADEASEDDAEFQRIIEQVHETETFEDLENMLDAVERWTDGENVIIGTGRDAQAYSDRFLESM